MISSGGRRARAGFSLVELLGVMAVIAFMFTVAGVSIDAFVPKERLNTAVRTLTEQLRELRSEAISRNLQYYVEYDLDENRFRRYTPFSIEGALFREGEDDDDERFVFPWENLPPGVEIAAVDVAGDVRTEGRTFARFDPRGAASDHIVTLYQPRYENYFTIEVLALTGTFKFHRGLYEREPADDGDFE